MGTCATTVVEPGDNRVSRHSPMSSDCDLELLMVHYQQGDFDSASGLVHSLGPQLHRFFLARFSSREEADDLLQETWLRIHQVRHTYRRGEPVLPWVYAIARHVRVDHYRKVRRRAAMESRIEEAPQIQAPAACANVSGPDLRSMLAPLPESQREVIEMLKVAGMSLEEVARATSTTVGSVKQKAHRAYEKLRHLLGGACAGEESK